MNWLAHFVLSPPDERVRLGNWLADLLSPQEQAAIEDPRIREGLALHRRIDLFTDSHPAVIKSRERLPEGSRRFSSILLDVAWDHFLSRDFQRRVGRPLDTFVDEIHSGLVACSPLMSPEAREVRDRMVAEEWLRSYMTLDGYQLTLSRISNRLSPRARSRFDPAAATRHISADYAFFDAAFPELWSGLVAHVPEAGLGSHPVFAAGFPGGS